MTNNEIIEQVVADPLVRQQHTRSVNGAPVELSDVALRVIAAGELQNEVNSFLNRPGIKRELLEKDFSLTLSTGTDVTQGRTFTLKSYIGSVINITIGTASRPLKKWPTREEFDRWYYENVGESTSSDTATGWLEWDRDTDGKLVILISSGMGDNTTANIHYVRKVSQPVDVNILPDDVHYVIVTGVKNRASGGKYQFSYDMEIAQVADRLDSMIGGVSPMRLAQEVRDENWRISQLMGGSVGSWPRVRSSDP